MPWEKIGRFLKVGVIVIGLILLLGVFNNMFKDYDRTVTDKPVIKTEANMRPLSLNEQEKQEKVINICLDLYEKAVEDNKATDLEMIRNIVERFGQNGYSAVDSKNQINMTNAEQVIEFCKMVNERNAANLTIIEVTYTGGFVTYDLETAKGVTNITKKCYRYRQGTMEKTFTGSYCAENWQYTDDGYLMFSGDYFSQEMYVLTLSEAEEHTAFRVAPLDEECRKLNRQYLLPIGYVCNNMFLTDWSEEDFGELNFYDLYDLLYARVNLEPIPYTANENPSIGTVYQIPKDEFERVIFPYFKIGSKTLQSKTIYDIEKAVYEYKPRGLYDAGHTDYPYSEVIRYTKNQDQTLTLMVNVVFPYMGDSKVYTHEVIVRPLANGEAEYVSNRILSPHGNVEAPWYTPRLTETEWNELYESAEDAVGFFTQAAECLLTEAEKKELQNFTLQAAWQVREIYRNVEMTEGTSYESNIKDFTDEQRKAVVALLGKAGYIGITQGCNMENPQKLEMFYETYLKNQDTMVTVFDINHDGLLGAVTFVYRNKQLQTYYIGIGWEKDGIPKLKTTLVSDVAEIKLTQKGYFIYAYKDVPVHAAACQYWRIKPLSDECRALTKKYISGLSYVNYNMLVTNWDSSNVEDILMPCMFEDIYRIDTGANFKLKGEDIPAQLYEDIMLRYFPVTKEQLRKWGKYDAGRGSYHYDMIYASPYAPFGEVVDYTTNSDGTITLIVDGVWPDYNSDCAFTNKIVVQPFMDGTFRYLSNHIEEKELAIPFS